jgi:hypothetical protein
VFNIGANVNFPILETTSRVYFKVWEMACFAGFLMGREAARHGAPAARVDLLHRRHASTRGREGMSAFSGAARAARAGAKHGARTWPKNLHVAHLIIDAAIDTAFIRDNFPDRYATKAQDGIVNPDHIADTYWMLHQQPRDAWTHELDMRPWIEHW